MAADFGFKNLRWLKQDGIVAEEKVGGGNLWAKARATPKPPGFGKCFARWEPARKWVPFADRKAIRRTCKTGMTAALIWPADWQI
jgi:hypothetical protein